MVELIPAQVLLGSTPATTPTLRVLVESDILLKGRIAADAQIASGCSILFPNVLWLFCVPDNLVVSYDYWWFLYISYIFPIYFLYISYQYWRYQSDFQSPNISKKPRGTCNDLMHGHGHHDNVANFRQAIPDPFVGWVKDVYPLVNKHRPWKSPMFNGN